MITLRRTWWTLVVLTRWFLGDSTAFRQTPCPSPAHVLPLRDPEVNGTQSAVRRVPAGVRGEQDQGQSVRRVHAVPRRCVGVHQQPAALLAQQGHHQRHSGVPTRLVALSAARCAAATCRAERYCNCAGPPLAVCSRAVTGDALSLHTTPEQMPLCYHPSIEYKLDASAVEVKSDALFPGLVAGKVRREEIIDELKDAGVKVRVRLRSVYAHARMPLATAGAGVVVVPVMDVRSCCA